MNGFEEIAQLAGYRDGISNKGYEHIEGPPGFTGDYNRLTLMIKVNVLGAAIYGDAWPDLREEANADNVRASFGMAGMWRIEDDEERERERLVWVETILEEQALNCYRIGWRHAKPEYSRHIY